MERGKTPGKDGISVDLIQNAGEIAAIKLAKSSQPVPPIHKIQNNPGNRQGSAADSQLQTKPHTSPNKIENK